MPPPVVDSHTHIFCWGEDPREGFLSPALQRRLLTRIVRRLSGVDCELGETLTEKMRNRLFKQLDASSLDYIVLLAQDAVYREDGSRDDTATHFYVSNDYVFDVARQNAKIIPCPSINPWRSDALAELERCCAAGARIVKIHTAIQGVDPALARFDPFYHLAKQLGMVLMFHTGYEHSCHVVSQQFTNPARLARPLDTGLTVIAAHCGTCTFFDKETYYPAFIDMMHRYDNLYGDTAILASLIRPRALARLAREPKSVRSRILHGSDYPLPPSRLPYLNRVGLFPRERRNPLDLDLRIKRSFDIDPSYTARILTLLNGDAS